MRHTGAKTELLYSDKEPEKQENGLTVEKARLHRGETLSIPIKLRGVEIGVVDVRSDDFRGWEQDELDIVSAIIERAAIAMENARLLYESQRQAAKEQKIGEVTSRIGASIHMRNVLQTAVEELGRALPGSEVVIQFETDKTESSPV